ncbi:MAG: exodeoxyribonuclease VII large subunit [Draconibacterium sp.]|nr:MAG: exodeoxyribonuclease VII large subunit [Draconibacterium sp.]
MEHKLTLSELNEKIKAAITEAFLSPVWVVAEISELKENRNGHCYLELVEKEEEEITARARATIWSYTYRMVKPYFETTTGHPFSEGIKILVQVSVEYHPSFGLSLNIKDIDPVYTAGDMALQRKAIVVKLQEKGVFDMNRELQIPMLPQKIAVISSATAAGYQDFMNQLENNARGFKFYTHLFQAVMQGAEAVPSIICALEQIYRYDKFFDAVVIIRGGGATADLSSFDNYELALHITQFPLPVITGIGHEKDDTIIDLVAHTRMKTPTAVAEFLIGGMERAYENLLQQESNLAFLVKQRIDSHFDELSHLMAKMSQGALAFIHKKNLKLIKKGTDIQRSIRTFTFSKEGELTKQKHRFFTSGSMWKIKSENHLKRKRDDLKRITSEILITRHSKINYLQETVVKEIRSYIHKEKERIHLFENGVRLLNPENVLKRGYSLTLKDGKIVKSVLAVNEKDVIATQLSDGKIQSKILKKENGYKKDNL